MSQHLIEFKKHVASLLLTYNENDLLVKFDFKPGQMQQQQLDYLYKNLPFNLADLGRWKTFPNTIVNEVPEDLSFITFWDTYANKVGNKSRCEKKWNLMVDNEKAKAMRYILAYNTYLVKNHGITKAFPETYIDQERWNN